MTYPQDKKVPLVPLLLCKVFCCCRTGVRPSVGCGGDGGGLAGQVGCQHGGGWGLV